VFDDRWPFRSDVLILIRSNNDNKKRTTVERPHVLRFAFRKSRGTAVARVSRRRTVRASRRTFGPRERLPTDGLGFPGHVRRRRRIDMASVRPWRAGGARVRTGRTVTRRVQVGSYARTCKRSGDRITG